MIRANDLKVGNFIKFNNHLEKEKKVQVNLRFFASWAGGRSPDEMKVDEEISNYYTGIQLTPEILEKNCGATIWDRDTMMKTYKIKVGEFIYLLVNLYDGSCAIIHINGNCSGDFGCIKHLHQLQNLVYSLTGSELEVVW